MTASEIFRRSLATVIRSTRRSPLFRHPLFSVIEIDDPIEPDRPFVQYGTLPELEHEFSFSQNNVPAHLKLTIGRAARERTIAKIIEEYELPAVQRFKSILGDAEAFETNFDDPENWQHNPYFCYIDVAPEASEDSVRYWAGNRSRALSHPVWRRWFFHPHSKVYHGEEAALRALAVLERSDRY